MRKVLLLCVATLFLAACEKAEPYDFRHGQRPLVAEANYSGPTAEHKISYTYDSMGRVIGMYKEGRTIS